MARRRRQSSVASSHSRKRTGSYHIEALEDRTYFVVLHSGDVFEFFAENTHYERIVVGGNPGSTTIELIGGRVNTQTSQFSLNPMQGVMYAGPDAPGGITNINGGYVNSQANQQANNQQQVSDTIFAIYISKSDASTNIAVAGVPDLTATSRPMQPFTGNVGNVRANTTTGNRTVGAPDGTGTAFLGARTVNPPNVTGNDFIPILQNWVVPAGMFSTLPANVTGIGPGVTMAPGNNLGQFLWGGAITGTVMLHGSVGLFYSGWLLTGQADGGLRTGLTGYVHHNFTVDGDIHNLLVNGSIGTDNDTPSKFPQNAGNEPAAVPYKSGFDMFVGGRAGEIQSLDSIVGNVHVANSQPVANFNNVPFQELENIGPTGFDPWDGNNVFSTGIATLNPTFGADPLLTDDTFNNPQYLGIIDPQGDVVVNGLLQNEATNVDDSVDFYGVPLMAGQTVTVQLTTPISSVGTSFLVNVGIFDPDGRLVASDYSRVDMTQTAGVPFQFTAQHPGAYRIAVTPVTNPSFVAAQNGPFTGDLPYQLRVANVGNLGLGAIVATNNVLDQVPFVPGAGPVGPSGNAIGFDVYNGDFGGVVAGWNNPNAITTADDQTGLIISADPGAAGFTGGAVSNPTAVSGYTIGVDNGNLRTVSGMQIGRDVVGSTPANLGYDDWPTPFIPHGSVGLLQSTSNYSGAMLAWNDIVGPGVVLTKTQSVEASIGGDYQAVDAAQELTGTYIALGNIGSVRATNITSGSPGYYQVNAADNTSLRGMIDVFDVSQELGTLGPGGPAIVTGPGGNVRYFHCDTTDVFRDIYFGGGAPDLTNYQPGETASITDDSGTIVSLSPVRAADVVSVLTYPIRGSGGAAIVRVIVSNPTTPGSAGGLNVSATGTGSAEIGTIELDGNGTPVAPPAPAASGNGSGGNGSGGTTVSSGSGPTVFPAPGTPGGAPIRSANGGRLTVPTAPTAPVLSGTVTPLAITFSGNVTLDTYEISGPTLAVDAQGFAITNTNLAVGRGQITSIVNSTPGSEIVNMHLTSLGSVQSAGTIGLASPHATLAAVAGNIRLRIGEDGTAGEPWNYPFSQPTAMVRVLGNIGSINAAGGVGNVYAGVITMSNPEAQTPHLITTVLGGINAPQINGGINGVVGPITTGLIAGPIVAANGISSVTTRSVNWNGSGAVGTGLFAGGVIGPVTVNGVDRGASISDTGQTGLIVNGVLLQGVVANYGRFDYAETRAAGVTIPTQIGNPITHPSLDIGSVTVTGNGGIIGSEFAANQIGPITVSKTGFGFFDNFVAMNGNGTMQGISTGGYGVRDGLVSGGASIGMVTAIGDGSNISVLNFPGILLQSITGAQFDSITGQPLNFLDDIAVYLGATKANPQVNGVTDTGVIEDFTEQGSRDSGGLTAWSIRGRDLNSLSNLPFGHGVFSTSSTNVAVANSVRNITTTGPVNGLTVTTGRGTKYKFGGDVAGLTMTVAGPIQNLVFNSSLSADSIISASGPSGHIGNLTIHGNFNGTISATTRIQHVVIDGNMVGTISANYLGYLKLGGGLGPGSLAITSSVGQIVVPGDLNSPGNTLTINGSLKSLKVGGNYNINLSVAGNMGQFVVNGTITAGTKSTIANTLGLLKVGGDLQAGAIVQAHKIKKTIVKGQTLGSVLQV